MSSRRSLWRLVPFERVRKQRGPRLRFRRYERCGKCRTRHWAEDEDDLGGNAHNPLSARRRSRSHRTAGEMRAASSPVRTTRLRALSSARSRASISCCIPRPNISTAIPISMAAAVIGENKDLAERLRFQTPSARSRGRSILLALRGLKTSYWHERQLRTTALKIARCSRAALVFTQPWPRKPSAACAGEKQMAAFGGVVTVILNA